MQTRTYGTTGLSSSVLGMGCSSYWAKHSFPKADAIRLIHKAIDLGITAFDTGASYAAGEAERRLGAALSARPKDGLLISTKCGTWLGNHGLYKDFSPAAILRSVDESLQRLCIERIDILYLHGPTVEQMTDGVFEAFERLKEAGKIRASGVNSFDNSVLSWCVNSPIDGVMLQYHVLDQESAELIGQFANAGKFVVNGTAVGQALYTPSTWLPTSRRNLWYLLRCLKNHRKELWKARKFGFLNKQSCGSAAQIALRFAVQRPDVSCAVFGTTQERHLRQNVEALDLDIPDELLERIAAAA